MRIKELTLYTDKLQAQKQFHKSVYGIGFIEENDEYFSFQIGWTKLTFKQSKEPHIYHYCYLIPSNKLESAIDWLHGKVDLIETDGTVIHDHDHWNAKAIYFYDGAGNIVEFIARFDIDNATNGDFSYDEILCVNEMGAASNNPKTLSTYLENNIKTIIWKGDLDRFATNGNQEGMFLLVNNEVKAKWYPTDLFPESAPFEAQVLNEGQMFQISFDGQEFKLLNC
ncbi:MAG: hypothetical protein ACJA1A_002335 [Saprospiraceae bacterium]|jgi:hypothetical protein|tara:strand:- start:2762 stop:3436 length:675 start_codon:yes stop_codon:yes gene_type:complete